MKNKIPILAITTVILGLLCSCSSNPSGTSPNKSQVSIKGKVLLPDGNTPLANATVYVAKNSSSAKAVMQVTSSARNVVQTKGCQKPDVPYKQYACTKADGSFSLNVKTSGNSVTLNVISGEFKFSKDVSVSANGSTDLGKITMPTNKKLKTKIAIVTGAFDRMQDILAKSGFGEVQDGKLVLGTEKFQLYDGVNFNKPPGSGGLDLGFLGSNYPNADALLKDINNNGKVDALDYDIIFLNCGIESTIWSGTSPQIAGNRRHIRHHVARAANVAQQNTSKLPVDNKVITVLRKFVKNGGTLYATDWSYNYVEQAFPSYIDFLGGDNVSADQPEPWDEAEMGDAIKSTKGTILQQQLTSWLHNVKCNGQSSCLNQDGSITIKGFLPGWVIMKGLHKSAQGKNWVKGKASYSILDDNFNLVQKSSVQPMMITFKVGKGKVIYSSFHTEEKPTTGFTPQERILQYLVFY